MNSERQKTDAISDAVEIPDGATHFMHPFYFKKGKNGWVFFYKERWHGYNGAFGYEDIKQL